MTKVAKLLCNVCGKELKIENNILREDCLSVEKEWGYFSNKDLEVHKFCICEACYDKWIKSFVVPIAKDEQKEVLSINK